MVFLSTSGILGRFVPLAAVPAVWWRCVVAFFLLLVFCKWKGYRLRISNPKQNGLILLAGVLVAGHWVTYFYALKLSSVAIGMLSIFTYPAMTTLLEPLLLNKKFEWRHLVLAMLVVFGVFFLAPSANFKDGATLGLLLGLLSAFIYSLRNILMKTQVDSFQGSVLMTYQVGITAVCLFPALFFFEAAPIPRAWPYIIGLGLFTTAVGHTMLLGCFRYFSVSTVSLLTCIQPIYGILLGIVFFREVPGLSAVFGGFLILLAVVVEAWSTVQAIPKVE